MSKTLAAIEQILSERYDGTIEEKDGFSYIPWHASVDQANKIFGVNGYHVAIKQVRREGEGYMAVVAVTVEPADGSIFSREGVGYSELRTTSAGREMIDTAIKGAVSDATSRAFKLFGDAFGLFLYGEVKVKTPTKASYQAKTGNRTGPSEKQLAVLMKAGYSEEQVDGMDFKTWKSCIDAIFAKTELPVAPASAKKASKPVAATPQASSDDFDDFDEFLKN